MVVFTQRGVGRKFIHLQVKGSVYFDGAVKHGPYGDEISIVTNSDGAKASFLGNGLLQGEGLGVPPLEKSWGFWGAYRVADCKNFLPLYVTFNFSESAIWRNSK